MRFSPSSWQNKLLFFLFLLQIQYSFSWSNRMFRLYRSVPKIYPKVRGSSATFSRLFGSKTLDGNPFGEIYLEDDQSALKLDLNKIEDTVMRIRKILGYENYGVSLLLVDDEYMKETNRATRGVDAPTDILSFPMLEAIKPGVLEKPEFDIPDYYNLGDMLVDVPYVMRRCHEDQEEATAALKETDANANAQETVSDSIERGVSGAMSTVYDPELRVHMLLVHGMLHLVGHDHEDDDEYEIMVAEEERLLDTLRLSEEWKPSSN
jgi:probable rRNA maturation factor